MRHRTNEHEIYRELEDVELEVAITTQRYPETRDEPGETVSEVGAFTLVFKVGGANQRLLVDRRSPVWTALYKAFGNETEEEAAENHEDDDRGYDDG